MFKKPLQKTLIFSFLLIFLGYFNQVNSSDYSPDKVVVRIWNPKWKLRMNTKAQIGDGVSMSFGNDAKSSIEISSHYLSGFISGHKLTLSDLAEDCKHYGTPHNIFRIKNQKNQVKKMIDTIQQIKLSNISFINDADAVYKVLTAGGISLPCIYGYPSPFVDKPESTRLRDALIEKFEIPTSEVVGCGVCGWSELKKLKKIKNTPGYVMENEGSWWNENHMIVSKDGHGI